MFDLAYEFNEFTKVWGVPHLKKFMNFAFTFFIEKFSVGVLKSTLWAQTNLYWNSKTWKRGNFYRMISQCLTEEMRLGGDLMRFVATNSNISQHCTAHNACSPVFTLMLLLTKLSQAGKSISFYLWNKGSNFHINLSHLYSIATENAIKSRAAHENFISLQRYKCN